MENLNFFLLCFTSFFTLINPISVMPVFLTMTAGLDQKGRNKTAQKAVLTSFITLVIFAFSGELLFNFFGISVNSFRMAGGIIFFIMGQEMLQANLTRMKVAPDEIKEYIRDISITPLAIPLLSGPGAITNSIILMQDAHTFLMKVILILTIFLVLIITLLFLWGSSKVTKFIGETGMKVMMRIMGLIVMVIAIEFFFAGLKPVLSSIIKAGTTP